MKSHNILCLHREYFSLYGYYRKCLCILGLDEKLSIFTMEPCKTCWLVPCTSFNLLATLDCPGGFVSEDELREFSIQIKKEFSIIISNVSANISLGRQNGVDEYFLKSACSDLESKYIKFFKNFCVGDYDPLDNNKG